MQAQTNHSPTIPPTSTQEWTALYDSLEKSHPKLEGMPKDGYVEQLVLLRRLREDWIDLAPEAMRQRFAFSEKPWDLSESLQGLVDATAEIYCCALVGEPREKGPQDVRRELQRAYEKFTDRLDEAERLLGVK